MSTSIPVTITYRYDGRMRHVIVDCHRKLDNEKSLRGHLMLHFPGAVWVDYHPKFDKEKNEFDIVDALKEYRDKLTIAESNAMSLMRLISLHGSKKLKEKASKAVIDYK